MRARRNQWKQVISEYFIFSKWQRRNAFFLLIILVCMVLGPALYLHFKPADTSTANPLVIEKVKELVAVQEDQKDAAQQADQLVLPEPFTEKQRSVSLFYFDPNTASVEDWQKMGVREKTARTIHNYVAKGGKFRKPEDLGKIYGLSPADAARLMPYVRISKQEIPGYYEKEQQAGFASKKYEKPATPVELNSADTNQLKSLPGIGSKLAARIISFRDKLNGFYDLSQVAETYGLADSVYRKIAPMLRVDASLVKKININTAETEDLKTPYIKGNVANAIVQFRLKNGPYKSVEDLKKLPIIDEPLYIKIEPYLVVE